MLKLKKRLNSKPLLKFKSMFKLKQMLKLKMRLNLVPILNFKSMFKLKQMLKLMIEPMLKFKSMFLVESDVEIGADLEAVADTEVKSALPTEAGVPVEAAFDLEAEQLKDRIDRSLRRIAAQHDLAPPLKPVQPRSSFRTRQLFYCFGVDVSS